jgi:hypothetical protein
MSSYPILWYLVCIIAAILLYWLIYSSFKRRAHIYKKSIDLETEKLKSSSERIELDFELFEFKSGSYSHEVEDENLSSIKSLSGWVPAAALVENTTTKNEIQSYLLYRHESLGRTETFISQTFPFDNTTLKFYVLQKRINLYIDRFNRKRYFFELKK